MAILIEVAPGELIDKLTILEIKKANIGDPAKLRPLVPLSRVLREPYTRRSLIQPLPKREFRLSWPPKLWLPEVLPLCGSPRLPPPPSEPDQLPSVRSVTLCRSLIV